MASTFENNLRLEEIGTGEQSGTWGTKTNVNLELITDGLSYSSTGEAIANAAAHTITMADGVADEFRSFYLKCTGGGQACTVTLAPNTLSKVWVIENTTSYTLTFSQGSGANVAILAGQVKMIATDGAGSGAAVFDLMQDLAVPDLFVDDDLKLQSDGAILSFGADGDTTLTHTDGSGLTLNSANKIMFRDSAISVSSSADATLDLAADGDINLTAGVDINIPVNVGLTFGNDAEKIEGDGTDLTIAGNNINLTAVADIVVPANVGITFGTGEKIEGDNTDLTITSGADINLTATADINVPSGVGITFGDDGEKIEGDGTNLAINSSGDVNITATTVDLDGNLEVSGTITLGSGAVISEAELELLDGVTAGTAIASKVVTTDANIDTTGQRNLTITGELDAATGDFSSNVDIDGDLLVGDDLTLDSDAAVLGFGADTDVTLTHVADTGLLLNSTMAIQFNDASQFINAPSATVLDINATDEIELNATLVDVNANLDVSGTVTATGTSVFASLDISGDIDVDGTTNLDATNIVGALDVTGTITSDGLTVDGDVTFGTGSEELFKFQGGSSNSIIEVRDNNRFRIKTGTEGSELNRLDIENNGDISFYEDTGTTAKFFWDASAESLGIGTSSPDRPVHLSSAGTRNYFKAETTGAANSSESGFEIKTPSSNWLINSLGATDALIFYDLGNTSEAMRIDSSGNLLVGGITTLPSSSVNGFGVLPTGIIVSSVANDKVTVFGRTGSDGDISLFQKDGSTVGSIRSRAGVVSTIILDPRSGQGAGITGAGAGGDTTRFMTPTDENGSEINGKVSLGNSANAFRDLYLSGGVVFGDAGGSGTSSSNSLDSYEEGTWTPDIVTGTVSSVNGGYTKVGNLVTVYFVIGDISDSSTAVELKITGLPFAGITGKAYGSSMWKNNPTDKHIIYLSSSGILFYEGTNSGNYDSLDHNDLNSGAGVHGFLTYTVA